MQADPAVVSISKSRSISIVGGQRCDFAGTREAVSYGDIRSFGLFRQRHDAFALMGLS